MLFWYFSDAVLRDCNAGFNDAILNREQGLRVQLRNMTAVFLDAFFAVFCISQIGAKDFRLQLHTPAVPLADASIRGAFQIGNGASESDEKVDSLK